MGISLLAFFSIVKIPLGKISLIIEHVTFCIAKIPEGTIKGYKDLWKPELKGSLTLLDDERVIIGITLKKLGYSINETNPEALEKAKDIMEDKAVYPPEADMKKGEYLRDIGN